MKIKIFSLAAAVAIVFTACNSATNTATTQESTASATPQTATTNEIPFTEAKNYFVKNTYDDEATSVLHITSQTDFEHIFGTAVTMNENNRPTTIDFSKQHVIALIAEKTDKATSLKVNALTNNGTDIVLNYSQTEGEKLSYTTRPFLLLVVDGAYQGQVKAEKQ